MNKELIKKEFPLLMLIFAFGGVFGFIYEEIFYRFDLGEWVKRGTTFGPWIPIYGFGGILILALTYKVRKNPFLVFLLATVTSGVLELATGWVILTLFGVRLCARSVLFFGVSGVFLRFVLVPFFGKLEMKMPRKAWLILCYVPASLFALDIVISLICKALA